MTDARKKSAPAEMQFPAMRGLLRQIFLEALHETTVARAFERHVESSRGVLRVGDDLFDLRKFARVFAVAVGKAARPMAESLLHALGSGVEGIVIEPREADPAKEKSAAGRGARGETASSADAAHAMLQGFRHFAGGHPVPNRDSQKAAQAVLKSLHSLGKNALVIFLLSGGGSAMMEAALDEELTLEDLVATHGALVASGAPIAQMNAIRKHLSAVKGGRLALAAHEGGATQQVSIMVSDVPDGALDALASGPTMPDSTTAEDCYAIAHQYKLLPQFPERVRQIFARKSLEETPKQEHPSFHGARWWPVLSNAELQHAAAAAATRAGFGVEIDNSCDDWDYAAASAHLLQRLRELRKGVSRACLISGGEVTVVIPANAAGVGGRNQHFALHCATQIAGENIAVLSAGSDGVDGNSAAAGAVADGGTLERAAAAGVDAAKFLSEFNSYEFFERLGDAVFTGATGNNVRDLRVLLAWE